MVLRRKFCTFIKSARFFCNYFVERKWHCGNEKKTTQKGKRSIYLKINSVWMIDLRVSSICLKIHFRQCHFSIFFFSTIIYLFIYFYDFWRFILLCSAFFVILFFFLWTILETIYYNELKKKNSKQFKNQFVEW